MYKFNTTSLYENPEFQSALVRLGVWGFAVIYVSAGALSDRYDIDVNVVFIYFTAYLFFFVAFLVSVLIRPQWEERRYFSLVVDISATTVCIYLIGDAASPFFILYVWIFVSYGTRYGKQHLKAASVMSIVTYSVVLTLLGQWSEYLLEASFVLLALVVLPIYQNSLMGQLQMARSEAEKSNRLAGRFLSNMTNEMRSPLVDILTKTKELNSYGLSPEQQDKIDGINSSASMLDSVIGDVLDFYKMESKQLHLQSVPFSMHALVGDACSVVINTALIKQIELVCSISSGVPRIIIGDEQRLKQALINIIKTAISDCLGDELQISVRMDISNLEMLIFEIKGVASPGPDEEMGFDDDSMLLGEISDIEVGLSPDLGNSFARRLITLMGGKFGTGSRKSEVICWFSFPAKTDDFESDQVCKLPRLHGKKVFVFEPNETSRDEIVKCCVEQEMDVETVDKVGELSVTVSGLRESRDVDLVIIADSPAGRDIPRIVDICQDVLGGDLPLVVLSYKHNCLDLAKYRSAQLVRKPFIHDQLADAMDTALTGR